MSKATHKPLRILHVVPSYVPAYCYGGTIHAVHGLCQAQAAQGHKVCVYTTNANGKSLLDVDTNGPVKLDGVTVYYHALSQSSFLKYLSRLFYAPSLQESLNKTISSFDVVHLHSVFLWPTWQAARIAKKNNIPYILSPHGMLSAELINSKSQVLKKLWIFFIEHKTIRHANKVIASSEFERSQLTDFVPKAKINIIANGIDLNELRETKRFSADNEKPYIAYLGRINWKKGLDRLLLSMQYLPDAKLRIAGNDEEGYMETLNGIIKEHNLQDRVRFIGALDNAAKHRFLRNAELAVVPSYNENFALVVLEALANGCPVIVSDKVGAADIVKQANAGIVLESNDNMPRRIAKAIQTLLDSPDQRQRLSKNGQQWVEQFYDWSMIAKNVTSLYQEIITKTSDNSMTPSQTEQ